MARNLQFPPSVKAGIPRLGDTPKGWSRVTFGDVLHRVERPVILDDATEYQLVVAKRNRGGIAPRERLPGRQVLTKTQFEVHAGDFLISKRQIVHGACGIVPPDLHGSVVSNEYAVLHARNGLNLKYLACYTHSLHFQQTCFHASVGVAVEKMLFRLDEWLRHKFDLPPKPVQDRIVNLLSRWEEAIFTTKKLIERKRHLKNALAQRLLTGSQCMNGADHGWQPYELGAIASLIFSNVDKKTNSHETPIRLCNYTDVYYNDEITPDLAFMCASASEAEINKFSLKKWDVLITKDSETPDDIAKPAVVMADLPGVICGYHLAIVRPNSSAHGPFLAQLFRLPHIRNELLKIANGVTRFGLGQSSLQTLRLLVPEVKEQIRIAEILTTADRELVLLGREVAALRQQKNGLMQRLLTGQL